MPPCVAIKPLVVVPDATLHLDGKEVATQPVREPDGVTRESLQVAAGKHLIEGALPEPNLLERRTDFLEKALATQSKLARPAAKSRQAAATPEVDVLEPLASLKFPAAVADLETIPTTDGLLLAVAEGTSVHLLSTDGNERFSCAADATVRLLRWWPDAKLLLAGCADEKVLAFDLQGERRWEFVSEMDPAVFRAAKDYWFKTAPGHEGIHGLSTGSLSK